MKRSPFLIVLLLILTINPVFKSADEIQPDTVLPMMLLGTTLFVGGAGPGNYTRIQDAIDNATAGDTVFVYEGFYAENIFVGISINVRGQNRSGTIIDGGRRGTVVTITASNAIVQGFTIQDSKNGFPFAGIDISMASNVLVTDNILHDNELGVSIRGPGTSYTRIDTNTIINNTYGLYLQDLSQVNITENTIMANGEGAYLVGISASRITGNTMSDNKGLGLHLERSYSITISGNTFSDNKNGMYLYDASGCNVTANTVHRNRWYGIWLKDSTGDTIEKNNVSKNVDLGIYFDTSYDNTIFYNTIFDNDNGIYFKDSFQNTISENNLRNDKFNAEFVTHTLLHSRNIWRSNYWERPRIMPYRISGTFKINTTPYPILAFDWAPLRQPPESKKIVCYYDGTILYVGGSGPNNYSSIQDAINHAQTNDTVYVFNGTYHEACIVNKPLHIMGENKTTTLLDGDGTKDLIIIVADYVDISGFTIRNSHFNILVNHSSYVNISGNDILSGLHGVSVQNGCHFLTISRNTFQDNVYGVRLYYSTDVTISYNRFRSYKLNAFFFGTTLSQGRNHWYSNYWDKPRHLPYPIYGKIRFGTFSLVWLNCDWFPLNSSL
jgi:nitrous oxidase accessory protein